MPQFRLNRRAVLRGAGGVAIALPWLELMAPARSAEAAAPPANTNGPSEAQMQAIRERIQARRRQLQQQQQQPSPPPGDGTNR